MRVTVSRDEFFFFFKESLWHLIDLVGIIRGFHPYQLGSLFTAFFETKQCHQSNTRIFVLRPIQNVSEGVPCTLASSEP